MDNNFNLLKKDDIIQEGQPNIKVDSHNNNVLSQYHNQEIHQNNLIVMHAIIMIWVGIVLISIGFGFTLYRKSNSTLVTLIAGAFVEILSSTILVLFNKSSDAKQEYFKDESNSENKKLLLENINSISNETKRSELLKEYIKNNK